MTQVQGAAANMDAVSGGNGAGDAVSLWRLYVLRALYAIIGGFHLNGPIFEPLIPRVLDDLGALAPSVVVPAHCTGWRAQHAMSARFGEAFIPNTVGTRFEL